MGVMDAKDIAEPNGVLSEEGSTVTLKKNQVGSMPIQLSITFKNASTTSSFYCSLKTLTRTVVPEFSRVVSALFGMRLVGHAAPWR